MSDPGKPEDWELVEASMEDVRHIAIRPPVGYGSAGLYTMTGQSYRAYCTPDRTRVMDANAWRRPRCPACDAAIYAETARKQVKLWALRGTSGGPPPDGEE